jgi:hypothetical protein
LNDFIHVCVARFFLSTLMKRDTMKMIVSMTATLATLSAALLMTAATSAFAQAPTPDSRAAGEMAVMDCSKVPADRKDRCEARNKAIEACKDKAAGDERRKCVTDNLAKDGKPEDKPMPKEEKAEEKK